MFKSFLLLTLKSIRYRSLRSWLTILGIVIGIMLVVIIFSLSSGLERAISGLLQSFGSDLIYIFPGKETNPVMSLVGGQKFKVDDLFALEKIPGVKYVMPADVATLTVEFKGEKKSVMVHGAPWSGMRPIFEESQGVKLESGSWPLSEDTNEIVLGNLSAHKNFKSVVRAGDEVTVGSKRMRVAGVLGLIGAQDDDNSFYISLNNFWMLTGSDRVAVTAIVKANPDVNLDLLARQIQFELGKQQAVPDFSVLTPAKTSQLIGSVISLVELFLIVIALISLVVGAVGIMNTMYTSVLERTKQIGIMKAIGASSENVLSLFLMESGIIGLTGGLMGILGGILISFLIGLGAGKLGTQGLFSFASLDFYGFAVILFVTFMTGIFAGLLPARQAAKMEPAEALRYE